MSDEGFQSVAKRAARKTMLIEFYVGLFFLVSLVCLSYLCINLGKMRLFNAGGYSLKAEFGNISGVKIGAPVELAGVGIGVISSLELRGTSAIAVFNINEGVKLRSDDIAAVRTKGIIGDRYIKIIPGSSDAILKDGDEITDTENAVELEDLIGKFIHKMD